MFFSILQSCVIFNTANLWRKILMRFQKKSMIIFAAMLSLGMRPAYAGGEKQFADGMIAYQSRNYRAAAAKFLESLESGNGCPEVYLYMAHYDCSRASNLPKVLSNSDF
jgi:hypothetical protein